MSNAEFGAAAQAAARRVAETVGPCCFQCRLSNAAATLRQQKAERAAPSTTLQEYAANESALLLPKI